MCGLEGPQEKDQVDQYLSNWEKLQGPVSPGTPWPGFSTNGQGQAERNLPTVQCGARNELWKEGAPTHSSSGEPLFLKSDNAAPLTVFDMNLPISPIPKRGQTDS